MKGVRYNRHALEEMIAAGYWYDEQRPGLGADFVNAVEATVQEIVKAPKAGIPSDDATRVRRVSRFPYSVVYLEQQDEILIFAVAHHSRKPGYWKDRK
jgi:plasmid stabilization system protein ParE